MAKRGEVPINIPASVDNIFNIFKNEYRIYWATLAGFAHFHVLACVPLHTFRKASIHLYKLLVSFLFLYLLLVSLITPLYFSPRTIDTAFIFW